MPEFLHMSSEGWFYFIEIQNVAETPQRKRRKFAVDIEGFIIKHKTEKKVD